MEDIADRSPFDAELIAKFVHRRAGPVAGDQLPDLIGAESPGAPGTVPFDRCRQEGVEAGELLAELFQGFDLVFRVRISFPNLHFVQLRARTPPIPRGTVPARSATGNGARTG